MIARTIGDILAAGFLLSGLFFMLVGAIGIVRFPDAYNRMHAASKCSTLGLAGLMLGVVFHLGSLAIAIKALLVIVFAFVATPVGSHILAKAAHIDGLRQWGKTLSDELAADHPERVQRDEPEEDSEDAGGRSATSSRERYPFSAVPPIDDSVARQASGESAA